MSPQVMLEFCPQSEQPVQEVKINLGEILIAATDLPLFVDIRDFDASQVAEEVFDEVLSQRERDVLTQRLGLLNGKRRSLRAIAATFPRVVPDPDGQETGVNHTLIATIERKALEKLGEGLRAHLTPEQAQELSSLIAEARYAPGE